MKIMIVEDEYHIRQGIKNSIDWEGLSAQFLGEADNGEDAWELYQECKADVVLLDINIPKMNGLELAKKIRSLNDSVQILFLTGFDEFNYVKQAISLRASDYLLKPISYQELQEALVRASSTCKKMQEQEYIVNELKQTSKDQLFLNFLQKRETSSDFRLKLRQIGLSITDVDYAVQCVEFDYSSDEHSDKNRFSRFRQLTEEIVDSIGGYVVANGANRLILLLKCNKNKNRLIAAAKNLHQRLYCKIGAPITIGVSETIDTLERIPIAYRESRIAADFKCQIGTGQVIPFSAIKPPKETNSLIFTKELELLGKIKMGLNIEESFKNWSNEMALFNLHEAKLISSQFCISLLRMIQEENLDQENIREMSPFVTIENCVRLVDLTNFLSSFITEVFHRIQVKKENRGNKIIEEAKRWVQDHLFEDVSLVRISDYLHLSPNYFSQLFRQATGETYISYTSNLKFERSKELLKDQRLKISDIASQVGYTDSNYFSIAFRKYYGMTPSEYRKRL